MKAFVTCFLALFASAYALKKSKSVKFPSFAPSVQYSPSEREMQSIKDIEGRYENVRWFGHGYWIAKDKINRTK